MNTFYYKCCAVPMCKSNSVSAPEKLFIHVPKNAQKRSQWLELARRDPASLTSTSTSHFCEDHFDLPNDMENYVEYTAMGAVSRIRMRPGCLPTKFACQPTRDSTEGYLFSADNSQPTAAKRQKLKNNAKKINECEDEKAAALQPSQDKDPSHEQRSDKADQNHITAKHQSKTKTKAKSITKQTSSLSKTFHSIVTINLSNYDKSDSETPSVACMSKTSDSSSLNKPVLKRVANSKYMVEHTVDKIEKKPQLNIGVPKNCYDIVKIIHEHTGIPKPKILFCLKKIRLNSNFSDLSDEFEINTSNACQIFTENVPKIAEAMKLFNVNLNKSYIKRSLPIAFRKKYYDVTCIINSLEIEIKKPSKPLNQYLTWSEYKNSYTIKYLISSTPNGLVNYISPGYGGRISDEGLVENCDFLNHLPSGSQVMALRGFNHIEPLLLKVGCKLTRLSTVSFNELEDEVIETKEMISLKNHIKRVVRHIREFSIVKPHACIDNYVLGILDDIIVIACGLINYQNSLIN